MHNPSGPQPHSLSSSPFSLRVWGATDKGRQREGNEDAIYPESGAEFFRPSTENIVVRGQLLVVADGMGGTRAGGEASRWAIRVAVERYYDAPGAHVGANLKAAIEAANQSLYQYLRSTDVQQAGCTMVAAVIHHNTLYVANVGDSRAYLLRSGQLMQLTRDHSITQQKIAQGLIRSEDAKQDPDRNVITRSIGTRPEVRVDLFPPIPLALGDVVLLCSDGLSDMLSDADVLKLGLGMSPKRAARRLVAAANRYGGVDNISVVLAEVGGKTFSTHSWSAWIRHVRELSGKQIAVLGVLAAMVLLVVLGVLWGVLGSRRGVEMPVPDPTITPAQVVKVTETPGVAPTDGKVTATARPSGKPTSTPLPTRILTMTPEPGDPGSGGGIEIVPVEQTLALVSPELGMTFKNPVQFVWQGELRAGQFYQLSLLHVETQSTMVYPLQDITGLTVDLPAQRVGEWTWVVHIVDGDQMVAESARWHFYLIPLDVSTPVPTPSNAPGRPGAP